MRLIVPLVLLASSSPLLAQQWNASTTRTLVDRAVLRRSARQADSALSQYRSRARGVVLFLAQVGADSGGAPRLLRADQLDVEVYWQAPRRSKQVIRRWRQRAYFPTDLRYHRDHLAIVTDDFGDAIRLGDGDEVRDVIHPLSAEGPSRYDYRHTTSIALRGGGRETVVHVIQVRPQDPRGPGVAGTLYLDDQTAALVRFRFGFTAATYLQSDLERIVVDLEAALFDQQFWMPFRQSVEVHRRTGWLDFPLRTIIRGTWEIGEYEFAPDFSNAVFAGGPYGGLRQPGGGPWEGPIEQAVESVGGMARHRESQDLLAEVRQLVATGLAVPRPPVRLAFGGLSDLVRVNRVQGLALGMGWSFRPGGEGGGGGGRLLVHPWFQYGFASGDAVGGARFTIQGVGRRITFETSRRVEDVGDWEVISPLLNSILAQERGQDFGDYVQVDRVRFLGSVRVGPSWHLGVELGWERSDSLFATATPASGVHRPNPPLAGGTIGVARIRVHRSSGDPLTSGWFVRLGVESGVGRSDYVRFTGEGSTGVPVGAGHLLLSLRGGTTLGDPPPHRTFVLGGRGTLVGEPFRAYGGTSMAWARLEWRIPVFLASFGGSMVRDRGTVTPFLSAGWTTGPPGVLDRTGTGGIRPVVGVAADLLFQTLRIELGWAPEAHRVGLILDANPLWWPIL